MHLSEALARLRATPEFQLVLKAAEEERPFLMPIFPDKSLEKQYAEQIHRSGQIKGFELLFNFLKGTK